MKTYLNVPYAEKEIAKAHGARWDAVTKKWFVWGACPATLMRYLSTPVKAASAYTPRRSPTRPKVYNSTQRACYNFMRGMP